MPADADGLFGVDADCGNLARHRWSIFWRLRREQCTRTTKEQLSNEILNFEEDKSPSAAPGRNNGSERQDMAIPRPSAPLQRQSSVPRKNWDLIPGSPGLV